MATSARVHRRAGRMNERGFSPHNGIHVLSIASNARESVRASVDKAYALEWYANTRRTAFVTCSLFSVGLRGERTITLVPRSHARIHARSK